MVLCRVKALLACIAVLVPVCVYGGNKRMSCYDIVPMPQNIEIYGGREPYVITEDTCIYISDGNSGLRRNAELLASYIREYCGQDMEIVCIDSCADKGIVLEIDPSCGIPQEGYEITVGTSGIVLRASGEAGLFYGVQTLRKSFPGAKSEKGVVFPSAKIKDWPFFSYRGAHLDVCRHFFTVDEVKRYIDMMALHNMNRLHWHITDDQGWRVEIRSYPKLTSVGSVREETLIGHLNDRPEKYDGKPYGGFYTRQQVKEIVDYAADRYIEVIPEVDLPGHMQAALAAYPELGCTGGPYKVWTRWGVSEDVLCAGNDGVLEFLDGVFSEIMEMFPSEYIHIGGDECPKTRWEHCPLCQEKALRLGLVDDAFSTKEQKLQSYVMRHVSEFLEQHGRKVIGWDEILEGGASDNSVIMSWRGENGGISAAKLGHDVVMTPNTHMYFDYYQGKNAAEEPLSIGGYIPVDAVYMYNPIPAELNKKERKHIIGLQANLWTEYIDSFSHVQYMVLPRWAALAENQWTCPPDKDFKFFLDRLEKLMKVYDKEGYVYARHVMGVTASFIPDSEKNIVSVDMETMGGAPIRYTLDGSMPTASSSQYDGRLEISANSVLCAAAFRNGVPGPVLKEALSFNMATARPVSLANPPCERYAYDGARMLVDGLKGDIVFGSGRWLGFNSSDMVATLDLGTSSCVSSVSLGVCVNTADGAFDARKIVVEVSGDGKRFSMVASEEYPSMEVETKEVRRHFISFPEVQARYVRVTAVPENEIPMWSWLSGSNAFMFCDEIEVGRGMRADASELRYVGRTSVSVEGEVSFDWVGTHFSTVLDGDRIDAEFSAEGEVWFNVFVDGKVSGTFCVSSVDTVVNIVGEIPAGRHLVTVQKRTEGEFGRATVKRIVLPSWCRIERQADIPDRHIEFIGNSLTCGFGTEGKDRNEPFMVSTENCNLSFAAIISRYFDAEYTFIAHSGQGAVRNYGDSLRVSKVCMQERMLRTFDMDTVLWKPSYCPDLVIVNLGTNDFGVPPFPGRDEFVDGYCNLLSQVRELYGDIPIICVCPPTTGRPLVDYLESAVEKMADSNVHFIALTRGLYNDTTDLGSVWHPNYSGQRKMAMGLIPFVSTVTGWELDSCNLIE